MNLLILDAGHAKNTAGKNNAKENFYEWEFNNDMQYKIKTRCEELGIKVFLTNPDPSKVSDIALSTRASLANDYWLRNSKPKSIFISIHAYAFSNSSARGTETYIAKNASTTSKNFAKVLNNNIVKVRVCTTIAGIPESISVTRDIARSVLPPKYPATAPQSAPITRLTSDTVSARERERAIPSATRAARSYPCESVPRR